MNSNAPAPPRAFLALGVLTAINLLNYLDRYVVPPVVPQLKGAMALSDTQIGWLVPAFMLVYMVAAPVFGAWGDRASRTRPIALGIFIWSLATVLSGLARNYPQLLAGRALVGIGEAAYVAISPALLADLFGTRSRGRVYSVLNMAIPVGSALGYIVGGLVGHHFGWRAVFFVAGVPGLVLSACVLWLPDPPRGAQEPGLQPAPGVRTARGGERARAPIGAAIATYLSLLRRGPYVLLVLGYAAYTFALGGLALWMPTFLARARGVPIEQASTALGAILVVTGFLGTFAGGWLGDYFLRYSRQAYLVFSAVVTLIAAPCALAALAAPNPAIYYAAIVVAELLLFMSTGPINAAVVNAVSPFERASAVALSMFAIHLLGDVPSPLLIGYLSDKSSLASAVLVVPVAVAIGGLVWLAAARAGKRAAALQAA